MKIIRNIVEMYSKSVLKLIRHLTFEEKHPVNYLQYIIESVFVLVIFVALKELVLATKECISDTLLST